MLESRPRKEWFKKVSEWKTQHPFRYKDDLREFHDRMRAARLPREVRPATAAVVRPETRTEQLEEAMLEAAEEKGEDIEFTREKYEGADRP